MESGSKAKMKMIGEWSEEAVEVLIESYTSKFMELQRSNLKQKDWQEVLQKLSSACGRGYSYARCRNKLDSLKKKFKNLKNTRSSSNPGIKWKWYDQMEKLMDRNVPTPAPLLQASGKNVEDEDGEASSPGEDDGDEITQTQTGSGFMLEAPGFLENGLNLTLNGAPQRLDETRRTTRKRKRVRCMEQMMKTMIDTVERFDKNRIECENGKLDAIKQLELKRNETNLEITRYIVESCRNPSSEPGFHQK